MNLVFDILTSIEATDSDLGPAFIEIAKSVCNKRRVWDSADAEERLLVEIVYHLAILESGGKVSKFEQGPYGDRPDETFYRLTWHGHDLLDSIRKSLVPR
ncbi:DUF2513 domain-containing protein [Pseudomonas shirazica]|uniref:DUF2513 domain-containing protein n=1 Tax=Pseudomonas putida group TaxID=136845 RepID=UPI0013644D08